MGEIEHVYVETLCPYCVIRVSSFPVDPVWGGRMDIQLISSHVSRYHGRWRNRIRNAWAVLRNRYDWSGFDFDTREGAEAFRRVFDRMFANTWPEA